MNAPWIADERNAVWAARMSGAAPTVNSDPFKSIPGGGGSCGGCSGDDSCGDCGRKRSDPSHQRLEWAKFVAASSGGNLFWQTAQAASAFFGQDGAAELDPSVIESVRLTQQLVGANGSTLGEMRPPPLGWGERSSAVVEWGRDGRMQAAKPADDPKPKPPPVITPGDNDGHEVVPSRPQNPVPVVPPPVPSVNPGIPVLGCCCVPISITITIEEWWSFWSWFSPKKGDKWVDFHVHIKYTWGAEMKPGGPCTMQYWEWITPENRPFMLHPEWYPNAEWNTLGGPTGYEAEFNTAMAASMAACVPGSYTVEDKPSMHLDNWFIWQWHRLMPGCGTEVNASWTLEKFTDENGVVVFLESPAPDTPRTSTPGHHNASRLPPGIRSPHPPPR